ncbi:anaerobic DMSO reductase DmsABC, chain A [Campylobacter blaseri]|uniref:Dimethyl sulfoxide reductase subunit A n=1 Tax=Campylobacter blaseri TaxID=2042961 RepID=A0A2P8R3A9_9BACT|nr:DMSO/selenate family reductase complex A subunit [Campylobacter blaseri]PSM52982.1 dimethyl sulfoxide reductase subunit A [Campylobacter blaseri]PSM54449.1 dimethyl sulfoxide reductase subunit A [Campylobacter blaseri]QKF85307.1 anaerobic DMSO reductase DmsABC, chain A [Campylobacter blaseri]
MQVSRRNFLKWSGISGTLAATTSFSKTVLPEKQEEFVGFCPVNCGSKCLLKAHTKDGIISHITTDNTGNDSYEQRQVRACLRGRSTRYRIYNPNRVLYPLKRVGKRGEGKFKRVSWDEALTDIANKMNEIKLKYGNEAFYNPYGTGTIGSIMAGWLDGSFHRLLGVYGGYLGYHNDYSTGQIANGLEHFYGWAWGGDIENVKHAKLAVMFGSNPVETRMGGASTGYSFQEMARRGNTKVICIDPRYSDTMVGVADEWIPIAPGTDAALIAALAYVMVKEDLYNKEFMDKYCVGFTRDTLPEGAPSNGSYMDYIMGTGDDKTPKTPEWASKITQISSDRIVKLAREIASAEPCYIDQGWGPQRHQNGEQQSRAIATLACLTGNVGILGGGTGARSGSSKSYSLGSLSVNNPVKTTIPCFMWYEGIRLGSKMSALEHGVRGASHLKVPIKVMINTAGNCLTNQHACVSEISKILEDESLYELIVDINITRTHSNSFADYILPSAMVFEQEDLLQASMGKCSTMPYLAIGEKAIEPQGEAKSAFDICTLLAEKLGGKELKDKFTDGKTWEDWMRWSWNVAKDKNPFLPSYDEIKRRKIWKSPELVEPLVVFKDFREDPNANPLNTPSGKIEIFSSTLYDMSKTWKLMPGQKINPLPVFEDVIMGARDPLRKKYPLQFFGYHYKGRTHSSFWDAGVIREINPQEILINTLDAKQRGIKTGDTVIVRNDIGKIKGVARVTSRIIPGTAATYQGGWAKFDENGVDVGCCVNTLTTNQPTAIAKANGVHSILVEIEKA